MQAEEDVASPESYILPLMEPEIVIEQYEGNLNESVSSRSTQNQSDPSQEFSSESNNSEIVLCLYFKTNKLAAGCFYSEHQALFSMNSVVEEGPDYNLVVALYNQVKPTKLITSSSCSKMLVRLLNDMAETDGCTLHRMSSKYFNYENSKNRLSNMKVAGENAEDREQFVLSSVDLSDEELVSALGALINYLESDSHNIRYDRIRTIMPLYLSGTVHLDEEAYINLQVFNPVEHPSGFKWDNKKHNQGVSLFSLLSKYCGKISLSHLRLFLTRPSSDLEILKERHRVISFYNESENFQTIDTMKKYLHNLSTLPSFLACVRGSNLRGSHWKIIYKNIHFAALVGEMCRTASDAVPYFKRIADLLTAEIYSLANHIYRTIDFDAMENSDRFVIKYGVRKELDTAKKKFSLLQETINKVTPYEFSCVPDFITKIRIVYIPEIGFLLGLPFWKNELSKDELLLPDLEFKFCAFKIAYYKSKRCKEMDSLIGDPKLEIMREESEIILELLKYIEDNLPILLKFINKLTELDCIFALAELSKEYNYVRPDLGFHKVLNIIGGRHPLLSIDVENFIPNDYLSEEPVTVRVLYGSNSSGKTVFLKQIALLAYMAHIGSFLPVEKAYVGLLNNIHVHMKVIESVSSKSSSFLTELRSITSLVNGCGGRSLAVLDEVCKGTNGASSVPIVCGTLKYFSTLEPSDRPHLLLASHSDLPNHLLPADKLSFMSMSFLMEKSDITFLYKISNGPVMNSALEVARLCGASKQTVQTAFEVVNALRTGESVYPYSLKRTLKWNRYNEFLNKFSKVKINSPQMLEKIKRKVIKIV